MNVERESAPTIIAPSATIAPIKVPPIFPRRCAASGICVKTMAMQIMVIQANRINVLSLYHQDNSIVGAGFGRRAAKRSPSRTAIFARHDCYTAEMNYVSPVFTEYEQKVIRNIAAHKVQPHAMQRILDTVG